jgi:dolichol-phosphate mannosyltransferase
VGGAGSAQGVTGVARGLAGGSTRGPQALPAARILVPVRDEGEATRVLYERLVAAGVRFSELRFVHDTDTDSSLPHIARLARRDGRVIADRNRLGPGVARALRWGLARFDAGPVVVVMGDNSDDVSLIDEMVRLWAEGAVLVSASRHGRGGSRVGGGVVKGGLSRLAGGLLGRMGLPTGDATNNFKLYDGAWLRSQRIETRRGFAVALELTCKAHAQGQRIEELPTSWHERVSGRSAFRLFRWLPEYLRWYGCCFVALLRQAWRRFPPGAGGTRA